MCHPDSPSVCGDSYARRRIAAGCVDIGFQTLRGAARQSDSLWGFGTQPLLCFQLPSPPSSSSPGRKGLTLRSTSTPHAGAGLGDTPALLPAETPSGASPASTPRRCWNDCSQRVAPSSTHSPGSALVGKAGRPSGKAGSSRALRAVQSRHSLGVCCY